MRAMRLNTPYGTWRFRMDEMLWQIDQCLKQPYNAPYGARCYLTHGIGELRVLCCNPVLMHLMVLGAF